MTPVSLVLLLQVVDTGVVETISGCRLLIVNLKAKIYIYMLTLLPKGVQTK